LRGGGFQRQAKDNLYKSSEGLYVLTDYTS